VDDGRDGVEQLFRAHYAPMVRLLSATTGDDASDAVQEAFVQAHLHWRRIRAYDDPVAWIRRVALNRMLNQRRGRGRRDRALRVLGARASDAPPASDAGERHVEIARALTALAPRQRAVVVLHYFGDLSVREIADALGISVGTVKSQLHDSRRTLEASLQVVTHE
jgi:RNA polymerase sigma-70 factor (ECF subfamily)